MAAGGSGSGKKVGDSRRKPGGRVFAARNEALLSYHPEGVAFLDRTGRFIDINPYGERMLGYSLKELRKMTYVELITPEDRVRAEEAFAQTAAGKPVPAFACTLRVKGGREVKMFAAGGPVLVAGKVVEAFAVFRDMAAELQLRNLLAQTHQRATAATAELEVIYRTAPAGLLVVDCQGRVARINEMLADLCRFPPPQCIGRPLTEVLRPAISRQISDCWATVLQTGEPQLHVEVAAPVAEGSDLTRDWVWSFVPVCDETGKLLGVSAAVLEVSQAKNAERKLRDLNARLEERVRSRTQELEALTARLLSAGEDERRRISMELHDGAQQLVMLARLKAASLASETASGRSAQPLREICDLLDQATDGLRTLSFELSPPVLYQLGLMPALQRLAEVMQQHCGLHVNLEVHGPVDPLDEALRVVLFGAIRESLMNVVKHAGVKEVCVSVSRRPDQIEVLVRDRGSGFDTAAVIRGLGLAAIRQRIGQFGGFKDIRSAPGAGTTVTLRLPLPPAAPPTTGHQGGQS